MLHKHKVLIICILTTIFTACKVKNIDAPVPVAGSAKSIPRPLSNLNLPLSVQIVELENSINKMFNGVLYNDNDFENNNNDNLILKITKIGNFKISGNGDKISVVAPLEIYVKGRLKKDFFSMFDQNIGIDESKDALFRINVNISSKISVDQDWNIVTKSEAGFQWRERPYLELGPVKIPIGSLIESVINSQVNTINNKLDTEISKLLKLKPYAQEYWNTIQKPIVLSDVYKSYLLIKPEYIAVSSIKSDGKRIMFYLGMRSDLSIMSGNVPDKIEYKPLPKLQLQQKNDSTFNLYIAAAVKFSDATELAKKEFLNKTFTFENGMQQVTINDLNIFNNGDKLGMMLDVNGFVKDGLFKKKFKGKVYAIGNPYYDKATQTILIKDFDFDVKSKDVLIGTAEWLFKGSFRKQIESYLKYPIASELERAKNTAQKSLDDLNFSQFIIKGKVEKFEPLGVQVVEDRMETVLQTKGKLSFELKGIK